jgi:hypothetical protein
MFKRFLTRLVATHNPDSADWEKLYDHGYRDVPRYVSSAREREQGRGDYRNRMPRGGFF